MAGIYIHIPFCRKACHYCDFHFSTSTKMAGAMTDAICMELAMRKEEMQRERIGTLYFGGGTPSLLSSGQMEQIINAAREHYTFETDIEFTLEANPDDLKPQKLQELRTLGVNRLSIGLQSFDEEMLKWMNRAHTAAESHKCIEAAHEAGFDKLSIDLIYGLPGLNKNEWIKTLETAISLDVQHISAYCLTVEEKTVLGHRVRKGLEKPVKDQAAAQQFEIMIDVLANAGYEQYEVSNFAKNEAYSKHNTAYWRGTPYLGIGPSAHSFKDNGRSWNVANNARYMKEIEKGILPSTSEELSKADRFNEWVMTGLRTKWGIDLRVTKERYDADIQALYADQLEKLITRELATIENEVLRLTPQGLFMADGIAADFFILEP